MASSENIFWRWLVTPAEGEAVVVSASCARLAAHAWGVETLRPGEAAVVKDVEFLDGALASRRRGKRGPFRVERLSQGATWAGEEGDLSPAPRWRAGGAVEVAAP